MGVLDGKVVLVTGGARGIGRETALLAAREGAKVVVNDLGGSERGGDAGDAGPAEEVAQLIQDQGGEAVSNSESVTDYKAVEGMFEQAMDAFGALHCVINPAGILRDKMFHKLSEEDWDVVVDVHLKGTFNVCRATINHFRDQQEGNYVLFTSTSGIIGNIGQSNYAAAKMGIAGLSRIIAMEGALKNVRANVIAPFAWSRLIATIPIRDEEHARRMEYNREHQRADQVAQLCVALAAPSCSVSGQIFVARGNEIFLMSQSRPVRGMARLEGWTPETVLNHCFPALEKDFYDLGATDTVFSWEAV